MSRHRPPLGSYGGIGGSVAAHRAELPLTRRLCPLCRGTYLGSTPLCPGCTHASEAPGHTASDFTPPSSKGGK